MNYSREYHDIDVQQRAKIRSPDAIQLIITLFTFIGALLLKTKYTNCGWKWDLWVDIMLYGSMFWLAFLLLTMIISFKNKGLKRFVKYLDVFFFIFHIAMWTWLVVIHWKNEFHDKCSTPVDLFGFVYLILGLIGILMIVFLLLGFCFGKLSPK